MLANKYSFEVFKCDDYMSKHIEQSDKVKHPILNKLQKMSWNDIWMRPVDIQVIEEFEFYREEFELLLDEIKAFIKNRPVIVEGAALLPDLINSLGINKDRVLYIVPVKDFQVFHYSKRHFINDILSQCKNPELAFDNWMERDARFANIVFEDATKLGMKALRVDGNSSLEKMAAKVEEHFGLVSG